MINCGTYPNICSSARGRHAALRSILGGIIMLWASIAVVHAAQVGQHGDVTGAGQAHSNENALARRIEEENAYLDRLVRGICRGC
jgi:hypothetical protein